MTKYDQSIEGVRRALWDFHKKAESLGKKLYVADRLLFIDYTPYENATTIEEFTSLRSITINCMLADGFKQHIIRKANRTNKKEKYNIRAVNIFKTALEYIEEWTNDLMTK